MKKSIIINAICAILAFLTHYLLAISLANSSGQGSLNMKLLLDIPGIQFGNSFESWSIIIKNLFILFVLYRLLARLLEKVIFRTPQ